MMVYAKYLHTVKCGTSIRQDIHAAAAGTSKTLHWSHRGHLQTLLRAPRYPVKPSACFMSSASTSLCQGQAKTVQTHDLCRGGCKQDPHRPFPHDCPLVSPDIP